jgi:N,N'-diacetyl-8-epilegionaminate cytidylyltransferase
MKTATAFVFARGGSKGLKGKNLRVVGGKPLVTRAIEVALACPSIGSVFLSTDDPEIASVARAAGAEVPWLRPDDLARDESPEWLSWQHAVRNVMGGDEDAGGIFVSIPPTAPLRSPADVEECLAALVRSEADLALTVTPARQNPFFTAVHLGPNEEVRPALAGPSHARRQDAPPVFTVTPVAYATRPAHILSASGVFDGTVCGVVVPPERAIDIDDEFDLRVADLLCRPGDSA